VFVVTSQGSLAPLTSSSFLAFLGDEEEKDNKKHEEEKKKE
jgi:hypothetical protein